MRIIFAEISPSGSIAVFDTTCRAAVAIGGTVSQNCSGILLLTQVLGFRTFPSRGLRHNVLCDPCIRGWSRMAFFVVVGIFKKSNNSTT